MSHKCFTQSVGKRRWNDIIIATVEACGPRLGQAVSFKRVTRSYAKRYETRWRISYDISGQRFSSFILYVIPNSLSLLVAIHYAPLESQNLRKTRMWQMNHGDHSVIDKHYHVSHAWPILNRGSKTDLSAPSPQTAVLDCNLQSISTRDAESANFFRFRFRVFDPIPIPV